jgi:phosphoglycerol transferase
LTFGATLVGFNYTYYAFFSCFLILVATFIACSREWNPQTFRRGFSFVALISLAAAVNLAPSWYAWQKLGKPLAIPVKHVAEADQYGLKIRYLVSPVFDHSLPPFENWNAREQAELAFDEGEPRISRLGLVATCGFVILLAGLFISRTDRAVSDASLLINASRLTLAGLLLATVGGFGSLFNLFVSAEIRAYSRLCPFIAFFSLVAVGLVAQRWHGSTTRRPVLASIGLCLLLAFGLYDQSRAAAPLNFFQGQIRSEWKELSAFVEPLESRLPADAMVFQLPVLTFLNEVGREQMLPFDHIKPYIVSNHLHWSYPALDDSVVVWQQHVGRLPPNQMVTALAEQHFAAIVIDRRGYSDNGVEILDQFGVARGADAILNETDRYIALDVRKLPRTAVPADRMPRLGVKEPATLGLNQCTAPTAHNLEWVADEIAPFVRRPVRVSLDGDVSVTGWAVDRPHEDLAAAIDVVVDDTPVPALYGIDRPDVASALGSQSYRASGFAARLRGRQIGVGTHNVSVRIVSADRQCFYPGQTVPVSAR